MAACAARRRGSAARRFRLSRKPRRGPPRLHQQPAGACRTAADAKSELIELQRRNPPFGGFTTVATGAVARIFASPGPIYEIEARRPDFFRMARALYAAGIRAGDLIHNTFSYHLTPAGAMLESAALALGCPVIPAGTGQTELQLQDDRRLAPGRLCRHAVISENTLRPRRRSRAATSARSRRRWSAPRRFPRCCEPSSALAASPRCNATAPPISGSSPTRAMRPDGSLCDGMVR